MDKVKEGTGKAINQAKKIEEEHHITQKVSAGKKGRREGGREGGRAGGFVFRCMPMFICDLFLCLSFLHL